MTTTIEIFSKVAGAALFAFAATTARADQVSDFTAKTNLASGGSYAAVAPSSEGCPEGEFTIEPDPEGGVLLRLGPDILADAVSEQPGAPTKSQRCVTTHKPAVLKPGRVDAVQEKRCQMKGFEFLSWHSIFTVTPDGFDHILTYSNGKRRECHFKRR